MPKSLSKNVVLKFFESQRFSQLILPRTEIIQESILFKAWASQRPFHGEVSSSDFRSSTGHIYDFQSILFEYDFQSILYEAWASQRPFQDVMGSSDFRLSTGHIYDFLSVPLYNRGRILVFLWVREDQLRFGF